MRVYLSQGFKFSNEVKMHTLLPTAMVNICEPSSFETQSNWTKCFWVKGQVLPLSVIDFLNVCNVLKLGTVRRPAKKKMEFELAWKQILQIPNRRNNKGKLWIILKALIGIARHIFRYPHKLGLKKVGILLTKISVVSGRISSRQL